MQTLKKLPHTAPNTPAVESAHGEQSNTSASLMSVDAKVGAALQGNYLAVLAFASFLGMNGACRGRPVEAEVTRRTATLAEALRPTYYAAALRRIGGAHLHGTLAMAVGRPGATPTSVVTTTDVWIDRLGSYRFQEDNDRDVGRQVALVGRELFVALRYGKMIRRVAEEPEPSHLLEEALGGPAAAFELVAPSARISPPSAELVGGAKATAFSIALGPPGVPVEAPPSIRGLRAWRGSAAVDALDGRFLIDDASGAILRADVKAGFHAKSEAGPLAGTIEVHTVLTDIANTPPIAPPPSEELVLRQRTVPEARELLRGLGSSTPPPPSTGSPRRSPPGSHEPRKRPQ